MNEPHTSVTALRDACVCMYVCLCAATYRKFQFNERNRRHSNFAHVLFKFMVSASSVDIMAPLSNSTPMDLLNATEDSSPCNPTPMDLLNARDRSRVEQEKRATARLQRRRQRDQEQRPSEEIEVRQARVDRKRIRNHERRAAEKPAARQARLDTDRQRTYERRAAEQAAARQARLDTDRQRTHERRVVERPEARQARLERLCELSFAHIFLTFLIKH